MYYVNHNIQSHQVQEVKGNQYYNLSSNNVDVNVTFLNKQGEAVNVTYVDGKNGTKIGNAIENLTIPNNYKIVGYQYNGVEESLSQLENIQYVQGQQNNIVVEIAEVNVPTRIFYDIDNHMLPGTGTATINGNDATIALNRGALRRFHVTSIQINGKTFNDFSINGDVATVTGNIPAAVIANNTVVVNFANGSEASQPKKVVNQITTGWKVVNGEKYYYNVEGQKETGWQVVDGNRYYFNPQTGAVEKGLQEIGGAQYFLNPTTGVQETGVIKTVHGLEYFAGNPALGEGLGQAIYYTGWLNYNGNRYYFGGNSKAETGLQEIGGVQYYFNPETGAQETGVIKTVHGLEYFAGNPALGEGLGQAIYYTGWLHLDGKVYYFQNSSKAAIGTHIINGKKYTFNNEGVLVS
ncbi:MAG: N-acetylmuramoyl-L-alanine amidase family protein [Sarcina sp.]